MVKVEVNDLRENTFFAVIHLQLGSAEIAVDSRPSDAIALALRVAAPIFVDEEVVAKAKNVEVAKEQELRGQQGRRSGQDQGMARLHQARGLRQDRTWPRSQCSG